MKISAEHITHQHTHSFSQLVLDYIDNNESLKPFYNYENNLEGIRKAIADRKPFPTDRKAIVHVLNEQYQDLKTIKEVDQNIDLLLSENTFTICSAHQPNLLTGHLYFFYKILQSVKLAQYCKAEFPEYNFVPVFYIGSEDNDLEELDHFYYDGKTYQWQTNQTGAVGSMKAENMESLWEDLFKHLGPPNSNTDFLKELILQTYNGKNTIAKATQILIHHLVGVYGVVCIDASHPDLKKQFVDVLKDELLNETSYQLLDKNLSDFESLYKIQAHYRPINLFYLKNNIRERIEKDGETWNVLNTDISFSKKELENEIENNPERFSPNVILRGLFQESILPNIAFIGGGSEVAYWMQLKSIFEHYQVFYPMIILRQSFLWMDKKQTELFEKLAISKEQIFENVDVLKKEKVNEQYPDLELLEEKEVIQSLRNSLAQKTKTLEQSLEYSVDATLQRMEKELENLSKKIYRGAKRKDAVWMNRLETFHNSIYPENLMQERKENFIKYYSLYGSSYFDTLLQHTTNFGFPFVILKDVL